ncbi:MAG: Transcriptional activator protein CzcR [candidate division WS6 bacterium OLB20]|uniref:Transcriptional activator protein CzcR n=1 Tax=candidate division WS6 bacterium OLB20 TaxID=1617426 RepID=A0A136M0C2_9BACT|nr:MAG: Transcriptional activator protein CzcR [candidate division WS6 bacterium OLB20]
MSKKVLVLEDEPYYQEIYRSEIGQHFTLEFADNGEQGLEIVKKQQFDVILVDLIMPIMSGIRFLEELQKLNLQHKPRIIVLTTLDGMTDREDCFARGADEFIVKSETTPDELVEVINE